jgi:hypothetical protein
MATLGLARGTRPRPISTAQALGAAGALVVGWTLATYLLEGRIGVMQQPASLARWTYTLLANVLIGTVGVLWVVRPLLAQGSLAPDQLGFRSGRRTATALAATALVTGGLLFLTRPATASPLFVLNAFAHVLQVSIAEVLVCWVLLGCIVEQALRPRGRAVAVVAAILITDVVFSLYHLGHSAPFNQPRMMLLLLLPGLVTSLVFFLGRDVYAAILVQNALGMTGVMQNVDPLVFGQPLLPLYALTLVSVIALIACDRLLVRRSAGHVLQTVQ